MRPDFDVIRDPLWDNIRLDRPFAALVDTPTVQRLRYVRQLGHAFLVYPGATHSRFEHALGTFHLCRTALAALEERGELDEIADDDRLAVRAAALLHDIGHYPLTIAPTCLWKLRPPIDVSALPSASSSRRRTPRPS